MIEFPTKTRNILVDVIYSQNTSEAIQSNPLFQAGSAMKSHHAAQGFNQSGHEKTSKDEE